MLGIDAQYQNKGLSLKGQYYLTSVNNTDSYNTFTGNDLGKQMNGYYLEAAYNILESTATTNKLTPFLRYEDWNLHSQVASITENTAYDVTAIVTGISFKPHSGVSIKADVQSVKSEADVDRINGINFGLGFWF